MKSLYTLLLVLGFAFASCSDKKDDPKPATPAVAAGNITVQENGGTSYGLTAVTASVAGGQVGPRVWTLTGKVRDGRLLQLRFEEDSQNGNASTKLIFARLEAVEAVAGTTRTGQLTYAASTNSLTGTFNTTFAGLVLSGGFTGLKL